MSEPTLDTPRKQILNAFLDRIWSRGEASEVAQCIADSDTTHHDPGVPWQDQTLERERFRARLVTSRSAAPDQKFTPLRMLEDDDAICVASSSVGTHQGDLPGLPASGRRIRMTGATIYDFEGDHLTGHWQIADRLGIYEQLTQGQTGQSA